MGINEKYRVSHTSDLFFHLLEMFCPLHLLLRLRLRLLLSVRYVGSIYGAPLVLPISPVCWLVLQLIYTCVRVFNEINRRILIDLLFNAAFNWASFGVIPINSPIQEQSTVGGNYAFIEPHKGQLNHQCAHFS